MKLKFRIVEVGEGGTFLFPIPTHILREVGWKAGDEVMIDIPGFAGSKSEHLIIERKPTRE